MAIGAEDEFESTSPQEFITRLHGALIYWDTLHFDWVNCWSKSALLIFKIASFTVASRFDCVRKFSQIRKVFLASKLCPARKLYMNISKSAIAQIATQHSTQQGLKEKVPMSPRVGKCECSYACTLFIYGLGINHCFKRRVSIPTIRNAGRHNLRRKTATAST